MIFQEEFGEVFERWLGHSEQQKINTLPKQNGGIKRTPALLPVKHVCNGNHLNGATKLEDTSFRTRSLPSKANAQKRNVDHSRMKEKEWSENLMADFDKLIAKELDQLQTEVQHNVQTSQNPKKYQRSLSDDPKFRHAALQSRNYVILKDVKYHSLPTQQTGQAVLVKISPFTADDMERHGSESEVSLGKAPDKVKEFLRSTSPFGRRGKAEINNAKCTEEGKGSYWGQNELSDISPPVPLRKKKLQQNIPAVLQNFLTNLRPEGSPPKEQPTEKGTQENTSVSTATQTSPVLSRSSSFTWMSDCSSSLMLSAREFASDDKLSISSSQSLSSTHHSRCDNGCEESECGCDRTSESRDSSPDSPKGKVNFSYQSPKINTE